MNDQEKLPSPLDMPSYGIYAVYALVAYIGLSFLNKVGSKLADIIIKSVAAYWTNIQDKKLDEKLDEKLSELQKELESYLDKKVESIKRHDERHAEGVKKLLQTVSDKLDKKAPNMLEEAIIETTE